MPSASESPTQQVSLWFESVVRADAFAGFDKKRGHRTPDAHAPRAAALFRGFAETDVAREVEELYAALRAHLGYKRKQVQVMLEPDLASIVTPDFEFNLVVDQHSEDPGRALVRRTVHSVARREVLGLPGFAGVFPQGFDGLDLDLTGRLDVEALIDQLEDDEPAGWQLDYGHEAESLDLTHEDLPLCVTITGRVFRLSAPEPLPAKELADALDAALASLGGADALAALALKP